MKKLRFTEQQTAFAQLQAEGGNWVKDLCRNMAIGQAMFFRWKKVNGGLVPSEVAA